MVGTDEEALADPEIDAVVIASSTDTHADLIEAAARAGKAIFCEKPLDLDRGRAEACVAIAKECGVSLMVGFNRRFDPHFARLERQIRDGRIGRPEIVRITSYDPAPPPLDYVRRSGGLFRDMTIHDFDMARWLLDEEPPESRDAVAALFRVRSENYRLRRVLDQEEGVGQALPPVQTDGIVGDKPLPFFLERYGEAYRRELGHFIDAVAAGTAPLVGGEDGIKALALADAALESYRTGHPIGI